MAIGVRYYLCDKDQPLRRMSQRLVDSLYDGEVRLPDHKGQRLRVVAVFIDFEARRPKVIESLRGFYIPIGGDGRIDQGYLDRCDHVMAEAMEEGLLTDNSKVVSLMPRIFRRNSQWKPTRREINSIVMDIWPGKIR